jgi:acetylornithine deacetylase/succinyl-diaminopimelate desuccinylase-like protein
MTSTTTASTARHPKNAPSGPTPTPDTAQRLQIDAAIAELDDSLIQDLVIGMTSIPSPTGEERPLAQWLAGRMAELELEGRLQSIDVHQANAVGRLRGTSPGPELLLYAPLDTFSTGNSAEDVPAVSPLLREDMLPQATVKGRFVTGLGASNPKGHGAAIIAAVDALRRANIDLNGNVAIALCAGGMPTDARPGTNASRQSIGQGTGCAFYLDHGGWADEAIICKPGWAVHWEEVGLAWFELVVRGTYNYVGSRHRIPYVNPIVTSAPLIQRLDAWFVDYAERWSDGLVAPQGNFGSIVAGLPHLQSMTPSECRIRFDLRTSPRATMGDIRREVQAAVATFAAETGADVTCELVLSIPGSRTDPDERIVRTTIGAWEDLERRTHRPIEGNSGATDANILRRHGIPTARVGMPKVGPEAPGPADFASGMNIVDLQEVRRLAELLIRAVVLTLSPAQRMDLA